MLSVKMVQELNEQINKEMYSAYLYMAMSAISNKSGLKGFSNWFMVQYHEEMSHAMKIYDYIQSYNEDIDLKEIEAPVVLSRSPLELFTETLEHEKYITSSINSLMELAISDGDYATQIFLQWYITEQIQEEKIASDIIAQLSLIGEDINALMLLDKDLAGRVL